MNFFVAVDSSPSSRKPNRRSAPGRNEKRRIPPVMLLANARIPGTETVMWNSPMHLLVVLVFLAVVLFLIPWLIYRHGKKVGDQQGYIRGFKEEQASKS
jgi:hypothetical protein